MHQSRSCSKPGRPLEFSRTGRGDERDAEGALRGGSGRANRHRYCAHCWLIASSVGVLSACSGAAFEADSQSSTQAQAGQSQPPSSGAPADPFLVGAERSTQDAQDSPEELEATPTLQLELPEGTSASASDEQPASTASASATNGDATGDTAVQGAALTSDSGDPAENSPSAESNPSVSEQPSGATANPDQAGAESGSALGADPSGSLPTDEMSATTPTDIELRSCSDKLQLDGPSVITFDDYDGSAEALTVVLGLIEGTETVANALLWDYGDGSGDYSLSFEQQGSGYALLSSNPKASEWGGGVGVSFDCVDASRLTGVQLMLRGSCPAGSVEVALVLSDESRLTAELSLSQQWAQVKIPFSSFQGAGWGGTVRAANVEGLVVSSQLKYTESPPGSGNWRATPGSFEIAVDDIGFY